MTDPPPASVQERLIESVPILLGRIDAEAAVVETEGSLPNEAALGGLSADRSNLLEVFPDFEDEIRAVLAGGRRQFVVRAGTEENCHFEVQLLFDVRRKAGAYFLVHDVTEVHRLQISLLECTDHEQRRVGQDLHDTIGQELTGIRFLVEGLRSKLAPGGSGNEALDDVQQRLSDALQTARRIAWQLSPQLDGEDLTSALGRLARHMRETFRVSCDLEHHCDTPPAHPDIAFNLYRIAQEACTNAVRHGTAETIRIRLTTGGRNILEIEDDGCGFDPNAQRKEPGMGLSMMRFRANSLGGAIRIHEREGGGTIVTCRFTNLEPAGSISTSEDKPCVDCSISSP